MNSRTVLDKYVLRTLLVAAGLSCVALLMVAPGYYRILPGTYVMGIDIGGRKPQEAMDFLRSQLHWDDQEMVIKYPHGSTTVSISKDLGIYPDIENTVLSTRRPLFAIGKRQFPLIIDVNEQQLDSFVQGFADKSKQSPVDARFVINESDQVAVLPDEPGYAVDGENLKAELLRDMRWYEMQKELEAPVIKEDARVTRAFLSSFLPLDVMATYETYYQANNDRAYNVELCASNFDGLTIWPGDVVSFNQVVGPRTQERGYRKAAVFVGDSVVDDYGGGVCQVSTTLYVAMVKAGFEIVERHNHGMPVSYVPLGFDATVVFDLLDLKMKNPYDFPCVLQAKAVDGVLSVKVFGKKEKGLSIEIESKILKEVPAQVPNVGQEGSNKTGQEGAGDGAVKLRNGYMVETIRKFIKDGYVTKTEKLNSSWYPPEKPKTTPKGTS